MDMLNHRSLNASTAIVDQNKNGSYSCYVKRAIQAGEEVGVAAFPGDSRDLQTLAVIPFQTSQRHPHCAWLLNLQFHMSRQRSVDLGQNQTNIPLQVTQTYSPVTSRMDHSLLQYGFVEDHDEPLLAAVDSATGFEHEDDSLYGEQHLAAPGCLP